MKIYTGFGDKGNTALFGGQVVLKSDLRVDLYGTLDELNSIIGLLKTKIDDEHSGQILERIQNELFVCSAEIATPDKEKHRNFDHLIEQEDVARLEQEIDRMDEQLPPLRNFILPGGCEAAALAHVARTVCRRAERILTALSQSTDMRIILNTYLNRLGDHLFMMARYQNHLRRMRDVIWKGISRGK